MQEIISVYPEKLEFIEGLTKDDDKFASCLVVLGVEQRVEVLEAFHFFIGALNDLIEDRFKNETSEHLLVFLKKFFLFGDVDQVFQNLLMKQ